jgi:hypothetical protein
MATYSPRAAGERPESVPAAASRPAFAAAERNSARSARELEDGTERPYKRSRDKEFDKRSGDQETRNLQEIKRRSTWS